MGITSAIVLFVMIWFMVLFIALPIGLRTQGEEGEVVPGTHSGSPANLKLKRKFAWVTGITVVLWCAIAWVIVSGAVTMKDLDWFDRMNPPAGETNE
ncbi:DUF1467 family protein [Oceaniglobus ichthyenteri]|uniref:DUF1467 family protein n=1 Tax=Oceaniglobus ichthyenteri TaxID=2136177 RepID=UPI000D347FA8|nr:DUF1467 family protein [Oceaniglobus ichthyenteri]